MSCSSSRWYFHFHSYALTIYIRLYSILELVVFHFLVRRGCIRKVSVQLVPKYFSRDCSTDSFSCSEPKNRRKQDKKDSKSRKEYQNFFVVANPPGSSSLQCRTAIATLSLFCRSTVAPLSHRYCSAVAPPLSFCCRAAGAPLSHRYHSTVAPLLLLLLSLRSRTAIAPLSLCCCCSAAVTRTVDTQSHRYHTGIAPLSTCCCYS